MKILLLLAGLLLTNTGRVARFNDGDFTCTLKADKEVYKVGEIPQLEVTITNNSKSDVYLIGALDGSDVKLRYPYCYYTIQKPDNVSMSYARTRDIATLKPEEFRKVKPGKTFNPYEMGDDFNFIPDNAATDDRTFKTPGVYKLTFHYSSNSNNISEFMGDKPVDRTKADSMKIESMFRLVPKIELVSNEIQIRFKK